MLTALTTAMVLSDTLNGYVDREDPFMFWKICAWLSLLLVVVATLGPIGTRPSSGLPVGVERFAAFAVVGGLFAFAYPRRILVTAIFLVFAVTFLEALQLLSPDRHGRGLDVLEKSVGAVVGIVLASAGRQYLS